MANTRELRRRIRSVKNTAQITKAMQMVAATKMRRAQTQAISGRPYSSTLSQAMQLLAGKVNPALNSLLRANTAADTAVLLLTTDKALCGALNTNVLRFLTQKFGDKNQVKYFTCGRKGRDFIVKTGRSLEADFENSDLVTFRQAKQIATILINGFLEKRYKEVFVVYPDFVSALRQEPRMVKLLPIDETLLQDYLDLQLANTDQKKVEKPVDQTREFLLEPDPTVLVEYILIHFIQTKIYQAFLETKASEHSARMMAMQNATDNAKELVQDLTLAYNQTRQDAITRELLEITTAAAALE